MIAILAVLAGGMFVITHYVARYFQREQQKQAQYWFEKSQAEMNAAQVQEAIHSLHSALAYSRDNFQYRLELAQALISGQELRQAQSYLLALWDQQPGNGTVNLELARIQARNGNYEQAVRYYHGAVYGVFNRDPEKQRRQVWLELTEYLLKANAIQQAQSELIGLAGDLPRDPALYVRVGNLFLQARDPRGALEQFRAALELERRNTDALVGAGKAAFGLQEYADAQRDLRRAEALGAKDPHAADLLELAILVRRMNPFLPHLSSRERARRVVAMFEHAEQRLQECATQRGENLQPNPKARTPGAQAKSARSAEQLAARANQSAMPGRGTAQAQPPSAAGSQDSQRTELQAAYQDLADLKLHIRTSEIARNPELADTIFDAAASAEQTASRVCGEGSGPDEALLLIVRQREQAEQ